MADVWQVRFALHDATVAGQRIMVAVTFELMDVKALSQQARGE
jgi:hypothetical protein